MVAAIEFGLDTHEVLSLLPYGVVVVGRDWQVLFVNDEASRLLGRDGATLWALCPELEATSFGTGFRYAMTTRSELVTEASLPAVGWVQARARPFNEGLLISLRPIQSDSSESMQARQAFLVGEVGYALTRQASLGTMLQGCTAALVRQLDVKLARIWTLDAQQRELVLQASSGLSMHEIHDRVPTGRSRIGKIAERASPYLTNDFANDNRAGNRAWAERDGIVAFAGYPLRVNDKVLGVLAVYSGKPLGSDATSALVLVTDSIALGIERKTAEDARDAAQAELRTQADQLELLNEIGKNLTSELELVPLAQRMTNSATRLAGASWGAFYRTVSADVLHLIAATGAIREDLPSRMPVGELVPGGFETRLPRASILVVPVTARGGALLGSLVFGHERAAMFGEKHERLLRGVAAQAAIAVDNARLFDEARTAIGQLERKNHELDQFASVVSHDLKTPLRGIANLSQWIEDDLGERIDATTREHVSLLQTRVSRLESLIDGILSYSRAGRTDNDVVELDARAFVGEVWELLAPPPSATLVVAELPRLRTPKTQFQQVLMNLLSNAVKYNPGRELTVEVGAHAEGDGWVFHVRDNGIGIPPEFHDRIWGLFQTLSSSDTNDSTGIGLSVVRKIVESRGGRAWLDSTPGAGATFYFTWPRL